MRTRRSLLGLLILAGVVVLAFVALRGRPAPLRSVPRRTPEATEPEAPAETAAAGEADLAEGTLWGTVTVPEGIDVAEVRIGIATELGEFRASKTGVANFRESLEVGSDGTFRREGLPLGAYDLVARHPSCATCRMKFELRPGRGTGPLDVVLGRPGSLLVRIVGAGGRGLGGEHVALHRGEGTPEEYRLEPAAPQIGAGLTDADGEIRFTSLDSGTYTLTRRGTVAEQRSATVRADDETVVVFDASASLFGRLLGHDGQPIPNAKLFLKTSGGRVYETPTDERGAFAIRGIAAGEYGVTASVKALGTAPIPLAGTLAVEDGRTHEHDLRLPAIRLAGAVVHAESRSPYTRTVFVSARGDLLTSHAFASTTADGRFEITDLYPGRYWISAYPSDPDDGYDEFASQVVTITPTPVTQEVVIGIPRIAKTARLHLTVRDRNGGPAADLSFSVDGRSSVAFANGVLRSRDADVVVPGVYDILLVPGAHRIRVSTQPIGTPGRRSCYYEEFEVELAVGQVAQKAITLEKLLENW